MSNETNRKELKAKLRLKLEEGKIMRSSKQTKQQIFDKTLKSMDIDTEKLRKDMEELKKQGGLSINLNK
jgi:hypothetical protein